MPSDNAVAEVPICDSLCPGGSFVYQIELRSEKPQGSGDDTALNTIALGCNNRSTGAFTGWVYGQQGIWGDWLAAVNCGSTSNPVIGANIQVEAPQAGGDDTAANAVKVQCKDGTIKTPPAATNWGTWSGMKFCPAGTAVCGLATRVEGLQGSGDDTSLNGLRLACCNF